MAFLSIMLALEDIDKTALILLAFILMAFAFGIFAFFAWNRKRMKRLRDEAREQGRLVDATEGRRTRSIIVTDSGHIILSALQTETITQRFTDDRSAEPEG